VNRNEKSMRPGQPLSSESEHPNCNRTTRRKCEIDVEHVGSPIGSQGGRRTVYSREWAHAGGHKEHDQH
jgi:hypothetical protein